jgi:hypothetical protein
VGHVATTAGSGKRQTWPPTNHFERLIEEAYPNHTYPIKHKLGDYDMMKNVMVSIRLLWGKEGFRRVYSGIGFGGNGLRTMSKQTQVMVLDTRRNLIMLQISEPNTL